jgi:hypothetical protein
MAKQRITVCVPSCDPDDPEALHRAIGRAMAPYDYNREDIPHPGWVGEWDHWFISHWFISGAGCEFAVLPGHEGDPRLVRHDEWTEPPEELPRSRCHGGPRGLLDLDTDRAEAAREAACLWDDWGRFAAGHPAALPFDHFAERTRLDPAGYPEGRAWQEFAAQPLLRALAEDAELEDRFTDNPFAYFGGTGTCSSRPAPPRCSPPLPCSLWTAAGSSPAGCPTSSGSTPTSTPSRPTRCWCGCSITRDPGGRAWVPRRGS